MYIFKTLFNSFFRTLGRILCYLFIGFVISMIIGKINVNADEISYNNSDTINYINTKNWFYFNEGNIRLRFWGENGYDITNVPKYFLLTFCSDMPKVSSWYNNSNNTGEMELGVYKTDIPCNFSTTNYSAKIIYFYGTGFACNVQGSDCSPYGDFTFYQGGNSSTQLLAYNFSNDKIDIDFSSGAVITQNEEIINQNQIIINQNNQINQKLDEAENTRKGIWETLKNIPTAIANAIKGLFIPDNFDFLNNFKDSIESKLGFIAEVPLQVIDFIISLADFSWTEFTIIKFPKINIFGYYFWDEMEIDVNTLLGGFKQYKYLTDCACVIMCVNTLKKWYDRFDGGGD